MNRYEVTEKTPLSSKYEDERQPVHPLRRLLSFPLIMRGFCLLLAAFVLAYATNVFGQTPLDSYIVKESPIAKSGLLANIGPDGLKSSGAKVR